MTTTSKISPNSEVSFWKLFYMPSVSTPMSLSQMFMDKVMPFKIDFYYGDNDWMEKETAHKMARSIEKVNRISYTTIFNAGHQIMFDNPTELLGYLL